MTASAFPPDLKDSRAQRQTMVDCQIRTFDVTDQRLLARVTDVARERFVPETFRDLAYSDVGFMMPATAEDEEPRYLLPPLILVRLIQGGRIESTDRVLDVGSGGGYSTAILSGLAGEVHALETGAARRDGLRAALDGSGTARIEVHAGALGAGVPDRAPFDVILVNGAIESGLEPLLAQLADGGRLLAIVRGATDPTGRAAKAMCYERRGGGIGSRYLFDASAPTLAAFRTASEFKF